MFIVYYKPIKKEERMSRMSYFNDDDQNRENFERPHTEFSKTPLQERLEEDEKKMKQRRKKGGGSFAGYFISGLAGVIVGALLLWLLLPSLATSLPGTTSSSNAKKTEISQVATEVQSDVTKAVNTASEAVVGITNLQEVQNIGGGDVFGGFFGGQQQQQTNEDAKMQEAGSGSGVIYKIEGNLAYIVTNNHVIEDAKQLEVTLQDGSKAEAKLVGSDVWTDLAVITIPSKKVDTAIQFGDSDVLKQGQTAIAIGNPLGLDFYGSVTTGVISGTDRVVPVDLNNDGVEDWQTEVIQTDAAINPGNSGGALVNINGELIGINSMKISENTVEGLGFAIPINSVVPIIQELEASGKVTRPSMGISLMDLTEIPSFYQQQTLQLPEEITSGVVVSDVVNGSAAAKAGVEKYDVIVEIDGKTIEDSIDLRQILYNEKEVGDKMKMKVYRQGKLVELELTLSDSSQL